MTVHSELGASKAERWIECPGSVNAERGLWAVPSEYAIEGSAAHSLGERCLRAGVDAAAFVGTFVTVGVEREQGTFTDEYIEVTEDMAEAVQVYLDYVRKRLREAVARSNENVARGIEEQFSLAALNPPEPMFGTTDYWLYDEIEQFLEVFDYKHGAGVAVDAHENVQMLYYALGAVVKMNKKPKKFRVNIIQPRAAHPDGIIRSFEFDWEYLLNYKRMLFEAAAKTQAEDAPRKAGSHCRFCKAAPTCAEQRRVAIEAVQAEFDAAEAPQLPVPLNLSPEQIGFILTRAPMVEDWFKAIRNYVSGEIAAGRGVPGWKLVPKRATRRWKEDAQIAHKLTVLGIEPYGEPKLLSPAQVEAQLKEKQIEADISVLVSKQSSGTNLVPDTDPRPALPSARDAFEADEPAAPKKTRKGKAQRSANT